MRALRQPMGRAPQMLSARALLTLIATVTLLITGLLGMHALGGSSGHASGHSGVAMAADSQHQTAGQHAQHAEAASAPDAVACSAGCEQVAPAVPGHAELMACVLALLTGFLILVPPGSLGRSSMPVAMLPARIDASAVLLVPPPPSLTLLSISRT